MEHLRQLHSLLKSKVHEGGRLSYSVPSLWAEEDLGRRPHPVLVNPFEYYAAQIGRILDAVPEPEAFYSPAVRNDGGDWSRKAVVYNLFVRLTTAFDHDRDGGLAQSLNKDGFRETGTFLKSIALLPYIKRLGANTVHLLPVTAIGADGKKGTLGSPYAIKNPYRLDENLQEPALGFGVENEFKAFVEAAHHLGLKVVLEFVFRTAARDSDWVREHPEWFYWIRDSVPDRLPGSRDASHYGAPIFDGDALNAVKDCVGRGDLSKTPPPPQAYRAFFTEPPLAQSVALQNGRWIGTLGDGTKVRVPGAFADWPPDDPQPPWGDVTYLKMYAHPDFNYMAYNTLRMYDQSLARAENINRPLWDAVAGIIPHYQKTFGIDGVMIDMGHALPHELFREMVSGARAQNPDFAFWEENFGPTAESREQGYNAAIGYIWCDEHQPQKLRELIRRYSQETLPVPFFATPESHNSCRAVTQPGGRTYSRFAWMLNNFIPAMPFIHSGFELGETGPVNTGLNFSAEQLAQNPAEKLALFSHAALDWLKPDNLCAFVQAGSRIRGPYADLIADGECATFKVVDCDNPHVLVFERGNAQDRLLVFANGNFERAETFEVAHEKLSASGRVRTTLYPGEVQMVKL